MPTTLESPPRSHEPVGAVEELLAADELLAALESGGDGWGGEDPSDGDHGRPAPQREWPLVPAVIVAVVVAALLTLLGMLTQIGANMAGSQLPGS